MAAFKTRYNLVRKGETTNQNGYVYADWMRFPIEELQLLDPVLVHTLKTNEIDRIDILMYNTYGVPYYDDLVLWFNNVSNIHYLAPGDTLELPSKRDLDRFFSKNIRGEVS